MVKARGFTLLEVLVATALSAVVSVMAYSALTSGLNAAEQIEISAARIHEIDRGLQLIQRDLSEVINRPAQTALGADPAFLGEGSSEMEPFFRFTRQGWLNPLNRPRSNLQRVEYRYSEGGMWRWHRPVINQPSQDDPAKVELFDGVQEMQIRFLDTDTGGISSDLGGSWREEWAATEPPVALELTLQLEDMGEIRRLFQLPAGG